MKKSTTNSSKPAATLQDSPKTTVVNVGQPILDRVLVKQAPADEYSSGGIIIPDSAQEKPDRGIVVAVGKGKGNELLSVKVGDIVLYGKYAGIEIKIKGKDYLIMRESDILMVLPE